MDRNKLKVNKRQKRRGRIRARVIGDSKRPRLSVFRSLRGIYVQLIDDVGGKTLVSADGRDKEIKKLSPAVCGVSPLGENKVTLRVISRREKTKGTNDTNKGKVGEAYAVGELVARRAIEKGIKRVVFDRGGYKYHGRVKAVAEGARRGGLKF